MFSRNDYGSQKPLSEFFSLEKKRFQFNDQWSNKIPTRLRVLFYQRGTVFINCKALTKYTAFSYSTEPPTFVPIITSIKLYASHELPLRHNFYIKIMLTFCAFVTCCRMTSCKIQSLYWSLVTILSFSPISLIFILKFKMAYHSNCLFRLPGGRQRTVYI